MMPDVEEQTQRRPRPDAVRTATLAHNAVAPRTRAQRSQHVVDLLEFGYCGNTRMEAKITVKENRWKLGGRTSSCGSSLWVRWELYTRRRFRS